MKNKCLEYMERNSVDINELSYATGIDRKRLDEIINNKKEGINYSELMKLTNYLEIQPSELIIKESREVAYYNYVTESYIGPLKGELIDKINLELPNFFIGLNKAEKKEKLKKALLNCSQYQNKMIIQLSQLYAYSNI